MLYRSNIFIFLILQLSSRNSGHISGQYIIQIHRMSKVLIIVDPQNDFCEGGSLAVPHSNQIFPIINKLRSNPIFTHVIITQDWHPINHVSFASKHKLQPFTYIFIRGKKQELWPDHCVAGSQGANISGLLSVKQTDLFVKKGIYVDVDSYSGFFDNGHVVQLKRKLQELDAKEVVICGLALDFCVGNTALDAKKYGFNVTIVKEATRSVSLQSEKEMLQKLETAQVKIGSINDFNFE